MVRRLEQHVNRIGKRQEMPLPKPLDKIRNDVIAGAGHKLERNADIVNPCLQRCHCLPDLRPRIVVEAGQDAGRASEALDALLRIGPDSQSSSGEESISMTLGTLI